MYLFPDSYSRDNYELKCKKWCDKQSYTLRNYFFAFEPHHDGALHLHGGLCIESRIGILAWKTLDKFLTDEMRVLGSFTPITRSSYFNKLQYCFKQEPGARFFLIQKSTSVLTPRRKLRSRL